MAGPISNTSTSLNNGSLSGSRGPFANPAAQLQQGDTGYSVLKGDTMSSIARQHNMQTADLSAANPQIQDPDRIEVGDLVRVPGQGTGTQGTGDAATTATQTSPTATATATVTTPAGLAATPDQYLAVADNTRVADPLTAPMRHSGSSGVGVGDVVSAVTSTGGLSATIAENLGATGRLGSALQRAGPAFTVIGASATAINQAANADTQTTAGTIVNTTAATGLGVAFGATHPGLAAADAISGAVGGPSIGPLVSNGVNSITTLGEAAITGNTAGIDQLNTENLRGDHGGILRMAASYGEAMTGDTSHLDNYQNAARNGDHGNVAQTLAETGDYWAQNGIVGGLKEFGSGIASLF